MNYYPININLKDKLCIVVGGGEVGFRKIEKILSKGGRVKLISPQIVDKIKILIDQEKIIHINRGYVYGDLEGAFLVFGATDSKDINLLCKKEADEKNILVNIVDDKVESSFIVPSSINRGDLNIAISTGGKSPALAKKIREDLEKTYDSSYGQIVNILGDIRALAVKEIPSIKDRRRLFKALVNNIDFRDKDIENIKVEMWNYYKKVRRDQINEKD